MTLQVPTKSPWLVLRKLRHIDSRSLFALIKCDPEHLSQYGDDTASKYTNHRSVRDSIVQPSEFNKIRFGIWNGRTLVGSINLVPRPGVAILGYWIGKPFIRRGYASAATMAVCGYARYQGWKYAGAHTHIENIASQKVLERCGFISRSTTEKDVLYFQKTI